ncbi:slipin family protein [Candidatus Marsarchaeota archaeon]|jgi:regulator of protease activity HflC (stomatin/prohibitin superfamily)|nr:slipin family protein [Candidatus Marsarchaeota archaeon]MCL5092511.1 slipin family protein [Candidatus Marsarchaeota archaeon]
MEGPNVKQYNSTGSAFAIDIIIIAAITAISFILTESVATAAVVFLFMAVIIFSLSLRVISEWNRMPVLRFGRYQGIIGPGLYAIMPLVDYTPIKLDLRVISVSFRAEKTLTIDNVPVDVEAILFWKVLEPEKAVLNVQMYMDSIQLASQTALRDVIGKNELSQMLAGRDVIGKSIKDLIEERVNGWGIDAISVEIRDVAIPPDLQNAMARVATSEREKDARVILAESESLAADKMLEAAEKYKSNIYAMQLRSLNMMYEISLTGKNLMVFIPTESKGFSIPTPIGMMGMQDLFKNAYKPPEDAAKPKGASAKPSPKKQDIEV